MIIKGLVIILAVIIDQFQRNMEAKMALQARNESKD
jgi:predicted ABC-type sugar transport system permease subunit